MFFENNTTDDSLYKELEVSREATNEEIKKSYRKLAFKFHPDKNKDEGAEERFKKISKAYEIIGDEQKRKNYDQFGLTDNMSGSTGFPGGNPFDLFENIFGGGGGINVNRTKRKTYGKSTVKEINVELVDIYTEKILKLALKRNVACEKCNGSGCKDPSAVKTCQKCDGTGIFIKVMQLGPGMISQSSQQCNTCRGTGKIRDSNNICLNCQGSKLMRKNERIEIHLKNNMVDGEKIVFQEMSDFNPEADIQGDIIIILKVINSNNFITRIDNDLIYFKTISLLDALCGMDLTIQSLDNRNLFIKTSEVIQPNTILKIQGEGMTSRNNLYIKFNIVFPSKLSDDRKKYIKKLIQTQTQSNNDNSINSGEYIDTNNNTNTTTNTTTNTNTNTNTNNFQANKEFKLFDILSNAESEELNTLLNESKIKNKNKNKNSSRTNSHNQSRGGPRFTSEYEDEFTPGCAQQ